MYRLVYLMVKAITYFSVFIVHRKTKIYWPIGCTMLSHFTQAWIIVMNYSLIVLFICVLKKFTYQSTFHQLKHILWSIWPLIFGPGYFRKRQQHTAIRMPEVPETPEIVTSLLWQRSANPQTNPIKREWRT